MSHAVRIQNFIVLSIITYDLHVPQRHYSHYCTSKILGYGAFYSTFFTVEEIMSIIAADYRKTVI